MRPIPRRSASQADWEQISTDMRVVKLRGRILLLVPALGLPAFSRATRGLTLPPGRGGFIVGALMVASSLAIGYLLVGPLGPWGGVLSFWLLGTAGLATALAARRPTAFVKQICTGCRLLPVIKEHEAIHLSGVASETAVWTSMKGRHTPRSLALEGDPSICPFCPIPKRLAEE